MKLRIVKLMQRIVRLVARPPGGTAATDPRGAMLVLRACTFVRLGDIEQAADLLESEILPVRDAGRLNLLGVIFEKCGQWAEARRYYGRAMRADRTSAPARQNLRRWFELDTFGRTDLPLLLGDEEPRLWLVRRRAVGDAAPNTRSAAMFPSGGIHHDN